MKNYVIEISNYLTQDEQERMYNGKLSFETKKECIKELKIIARSGGKASAYLIHKNKDKEIIGYVNNQSSVTVLKNN